MYKFFTSIKERTYVFFSFKFIFSSLCQVFTSGWTTLPLTTRTGLKGSHRNKEKKRETALQWETHQVSSLQLMPVNSSLALYVGNVSLGSPALVTIFLQLGFIRCCDYIPGAPDMFLVRIDNDKLKAIFFTLSWRRNTPITCVHIVGVKITDVI